MTKPILSYVPRWVSLRSTHPTAFNHEREFKSVMFQPVKLSLVALLLASGAAFAQPAADAPKADAPKAETPEADAPKADAPKADAPKADAPKADAKPEFEPQVGQAGKDVI